jgi:hypothetical protein
VINLSSYELDPPSLHLLQKGFNYALAPRHISMEDIICSIESITHHFPTHEAGEIRQECRRIIQCSKSTSPNLSKEEFDHICHLNDNPNIIILKEDKGNTAVIMNTSNYDSKLLDILSSSTYKPLIKNPINNITNLATKAI